MLSSSVPPGSVYIDSRSSSPLSCVAYQRSTLWIAARQSVSGSVFIVPPSVVEPCDSLWWLYIVFSAGCSQLKIGPPAPEPHCSVTTRL